MVSRMGMGPRTLVAAVGVAVATGLALLSIGGAQAAVIPGTPYPDVHFGTDTDNATNTFIQPPGVTAKQHMDNTDVLFGRQADDLLVGKLGGDTILGNEGRDILVGGPEAFAVPNSDVLIGGTGDDINIWAPGDGSDSYIGEEGYDAMVFAPFRLKNGQLIVTSAYGRKIPLVDISGKPQFTCRIDPVPASQKDGAQFVGRFFAGGNLAVTVRLKDVEQVFCPSAQPGYATIAYLNVAKPKFAQIKLSTIKNDVLRSIFLRTS